MGRGEHMLGAVGASRPGAKALLSSFLVPCLGHFVLVRKADDGRSPLTLQGQGTAAWSLLGSWTAGPLGFLSC